MESLKKWVQFSKERFDPLSHLLMILLFFGAHFVFSAHLQLDLANVIDFKEKILINSLLFVGVLAFFFKLRLYDEIKDYEVDLVINPTRPLVRGLVTHQDLYFGISVCIALELVIFGSIGVRIWPGIIFAIVYSLLMYKEFFIPKLIRPHLTTYAVSHTIVSGFLTLVLISAFSREVFWNLGMPSYLFSINSWCLFNIFEFGRKTFISTEERKKVESYSKVFGRWGAIALVLLMSVISNILLERVDSYFYGSDIHLNKLAYFLWGMFSVLGVSGVIYAVSDRGCWGVVYRSFSSIYIVLIYLGWLILNSGVFLK